MKGITLFIGISLLFGSCRPKDPALVKRKVALYDSLRKWQKIITVEADSLAQIQKTGTKDEKIRAMEKYDSIYEIPRKILLEYIEVKKQLNEYEEINEYKKPQ